MQPSVIWAQRKDGNVLVTVRVHDAIEPVVKITPTTFNFVGTSDSRSNKFDLTIELFNEIDVEQSRYLVKPRGIEIVLKKNDTSVWWPRLAKTTKKLHYISVDWDRWVDEDDEDEQKPGFNWDGAGQGFEDNSDDSDGEMPEVPAEDGEESQE